MSRRCVKRREVPHYPQRSSIGLQGTELARRFIGEVVRYPRLTD